MKKILFIGAGFIGLLIVAALVLPPFIDLGKYKSQYLPLAERALGRRVDVDEVRLRVLPRPMIHLSRFEISDNPQFSRAPFFAAQRVGLALQLWPLLSGKLHIEEVVLERPVVQLVKKRDGIFNFADLGVGSRDGREEAAGASKPQEPAGIAELIPRKIRIDNGDIVLLTLGEQPLRIRGVQILLTEFSPTRPFPYRIALNLPGLKPVSLAGLLRYNESRAALEIKQNQLTAQDIPFAVNGSVTELTGVPRLYLAMANDRFETKPIIELLRATGVIHKEFQAEGAMALKVETSGLANNVITQANAQLHGLKVNDPRAFNGLVSGAVRLTLPLGGEVPAIHALSGNGTVAAKDGVLTNVDLAAKIQRITGLLGLARDQQAGATTFRTLEGEFIIGNGVANFSRIFLDSPLMVVSGNGKMNLSPPSLDLRLAATLSEQASSQTATARAATFFKDSQGRIVVPLRVTGPVRNPAVSLDAEELIRKNAGQLFKQGGGSFFERFFRRR